MSRFNRKIAGQLRRFVLPALGLAAMECYVRVGGNQSEGLAAPSQAAHAFLGALLTTGEDSVYGPTLFTLGSALAGLLIGLFCGVAAGIALGLSRTLTQTTFLSVEVLRTVPSVALIPLAMLVFGFGSSMEVSVIAFAVFWPILVLAQSAVGLVEPRLQEVAKALELSLAAKVTKIILPAMVPRLFVALRLGVSIALVVAVTVEIAANPHGIGYALMMAQQSLSPQMMLGWLFWIALLGYAINEAMLRLQTLVSTKMGGSPDATGQGKNG